MTTDPSSIDPRTPSLRWLRRGAFALVVLIVLLAAGVLGLRLWLRSAMRHSLPQIEGVAQARGLHASVSVDRDEHGVPHITAASMDDLIFAQGYVTAQDRLWQMDAMRRHAAGELAEILGASLLPHDKLQRYLQIRATAEKAVLRMDARERHELDQYAAGVNAFVDGHRNALPAEFRVLHYEPKPWSAVDSILISFAMAQDLGTSFQDKLNREAVVARLSPDLQADLYPVGSWRDHPPGEAASQLTSPAPAKSAATDEDESQSKVEDLTQATELIGKYVSHYRCDGCTAGSNSWVVGPTKSASGHALLANDMHLALGLPGIWYEADLESGAFHVAGVSLPGTPFVIVGHNQHVAWGITNSGADAQDLYIEEVHGEEYKGADGAMHALKHRAETIHVRGRSDVVLDVSLTQHGDAETPILTPLYPNEKRQIALRWTIYENDQASSPFGKVNAAANWDEFTAAFSRFIAPAENVMYADDAGHIGYLLMGKVPVRGDAAAPSGLSPVPVPTGSYEWSGAIAYDKLPRVFDPANGYLATANARITPDGYAPAIALDWEAPYRNERIWHVLANTEKMSKEKMLALQNDTVSELDATLAQRLAYAIDHTAKRTARAAQAADLLRAFKGDVALGQPAPMILAATRDALWPMLLQPRLGTAWKLYTWRSRSFVLEELMTHQPVRWLPAEYGDWNAFLTAAVERGLKEHEAPSNLATWKNAMPVQLNHPIFGMTPAIRRLVGLHASSDVINVPGDTSTVRVASKNHGASERFVIDLNDPDNAWLNIVTGQSGNPASPWYLDQFPLWGAGTTLTLPFSSHSQPLHHLQLAP